MVEEKTEKHEHGVHESSEEKTITLKKSTLWAAGAFVLLVLLVISVFTGGFGITGKAGANTNTGDNANTEAQTGSEIAIDFSKLIPSDAISFGSKDAPITVVEFTDFSCPYCAIASGDSSSLVTYAKKNFGSSWEPIVSNLIKDYVNTDKVRLVTMYMIGHSGGHPAQIVAWCLNDQNPKLTEKFYSQAFATAGMDSAGQYVTDVENQTKMENIAKNLGADMNKLQACINSNKFASRFDSEQNAGSKLGIQGTPSFLIGKTEGNTAVYISGAVPYSTFKQALSAA
ncbi:MAG: thioredoxin domain-containing protein [Candidatus Nanoarchaeia archaeon]|nr:thioredoxin domain-containing protein [Candidatus Nanoarchaeia archaeon]